MQSFNGKSHSIPTGADGQYAEYVPMTQLIRARFILFRVKGGLRSLNQCPDYAAKVETTFRMAFKGGLAMFSAGGDRLCIKSVHFDGHQQYDRRLNLDRILRNVGNPPERIRLHDELELNDDSSDHNRTGAQSYDDCQLLQLTDLLVSGFRVMLADAHALEAHREISKALSSLKERWDRGPKGFSNSRWSKGFCISEGYIDENGGWQFGGIVPARPSPQIQFSTDW